MKINAIVIVGTRPEFIKLAPVICAMTNDSRFDVTVISTGQHKEMIDQVAKVFDIHIDITLNTLENATNLSQITAYIIAKMDVIYENNRPDVVLIHGDTQTAFASALSAYYCQIPIAHIEAGLRSNDMYNPFPEESNRVFIDKIAKFVFAPTKKSVENLKSENVNESDIHLVGNTIIDAQNFVIENAKLDENSDNSGDTNDNQYRTILVTSHRRESLGKGQKNIFKALASIASRYPLSQKNGVRIIFPIHPNPKVREQAKKYISNIDNIEIIEPVQFDEMIRMMKDAYLVITDSGGLQEEAPSFRVPILVTRETTERPEGIEAGIARLVGTSQEKIYENAVEILDNDNVYDKMRKKADNLYGDGKTSEKILNVLANHFV